LGVFDNAGHVTIVVDDPRILLPVNVSHLIIDIYMAGDVRSYLICDPEGLQSTFNHCVHHVEIGEVGR
jgi:hypothetical protein